MAKASWRILPLLGLGYLCCYLDRLNVSISIDGREAGTLVAHVGDFSVGFTLDGVSVKTPSTQPTSVRGVVLVARTAGLVAHLTEEAEAPIGMKLWQDVEGRGQSAASPPP